jgi:hypothetical protein
LFRQCCLASDCFVLTVHRWAIKLAFNRKADLVSEKLGTGDSFAPI